MIQLIRLRKTYHLRISKPTGIRIRLPCIRTERSSREAFFIIKIHAKEVAIRITYSYRRCNLWSRDFQFITLNYSRSRIETTVGPGNNKTFYRFIVRSHQSLSDIIEAQNSFVTLYFHSFEQRTGIGHILAILFSQRPGCQTFTCHSLITGMNIKRITYIGNHSHTHILQPALPCFQLCFTDGCRLPILRSYLHKVERHIRLFPLFTPAIYHISEYLLVFIGTN